MPTWSDLQGRAVVVTGGAQGLGRGVVRALAGNGVRVAVAGRRLDAAEEAANEARALGADAFAVSADVADPKAGRRVVEAAAARFGALDGLVNNAAWFTVEPLLEATPAGFSRMFGTNALGPLLFAQAFAAHVFARGGEGAVVNVSSIAGARPAQGCGLYSASKAALDALTKVMAQEWTPRGVRVNSVAPGHIETPGVTEDFAAGRLDRAAMSAAIPARRIASPSDVAQAVLFLLSPRAHFAGASLTVDGGEIM